MPGVCIQCSMRALLDGNTAPTFDETVEEHMARLHPDLEKTLRERVEMEEELRARGLPLRPPPPPEAD